MSLSRTSWRVAGIVNIETGVLRELEGQDNCLNYWLAFGSKIFIAQAYASFGDGNYTADYNANSIVSIGFRGTAAYVLDDPSLFSTALQHMRSFVLTNNELRLYSLPSEHYRRFEWYDELSNGYLLFKRLGL